MGSPDICRTATNSRLTPHRRLGEFLKVRLAGGLNDRLSLPVMGLLVMWVPVLLLSSFGCGNITPPPKAPTEIPVTVSLAVEHELIDFDEFVGRTEPSETVEVRARVSGFVEDVTFSDGERVALDKPLYVIQREEYAAIFLQAETLLETARVRAELTQAKLARSQRLIESNAISKDEYDEAVAANKVAQAEIAVAEADVARAQLNLDYTEIKAPIAGRIDRAMVTRGNLVTGGVGNGTLLTRIVANDPMFVYFEADESAVLRYRRSLEAAGVTLSALPTLKDRQPLCRVRLADEPGFPHLGRIDFAENRLDSGTGTIRIRAVLGNSSELMTGGMFVRVRVPMSSRYKAILVPDSAIGTDQTIKYVMVVTSENKVERREVTVGDKRGEARVITSGLQAGERVISRGLQRVRNGQPVKVDRTIELVIDPVLLDGDLPDSAVLPGTESVESADPVPAATATE